MENESILDIISEVTELNDMHEFMQDEELDRALASIVKLTMTSNLSPAKAATLIVKMQAASARFKMQATTYKVINTGRSGTDQYTKKNVYYAASDVLDKLVDALKYMARYGV